MHPTENINVRLIEPLITPRQLKSEQPLTPSTLQTVVDSRKALMRVLVGDDPRMMVVVGPCSIHSEEVGLEYARRLRGLADRVSDQMLLLMRVYFEKPRTTVGWKGLINDPHLNDTFNMAEGFRIARRILREVTTMGLPAATEMLEPITPQYIADLITLASIGARTTESPTHRQLASGLSMPVGYKNGTDGSLQTALDAMTAARSPHSFLGIDNDGRTCIVHSKGNPWGHLILRGGRSGPNYEPEQLRHAADRLRAAGLSDRMLVDCSHANSNKDFRRQSAVWKSVLDERREGNATVMGLMLESNLNEGSQQLCADVSQLSFGVSITDPCIGWAETEDLILDAHSRLMQHQAAATP